jgi:3-phenylpropionate/cinnamic acid dioxygenase small subunit
MRVRSPGVNDWTEISRLMYRYAACIDEGDLDGVADLFVHGEFRSAGSHAVLRGRDEVRRMFDGVVLYGDTPRTHHVITNVTIDVEDGATEATGSCYFAVLQGVEDGRPIETILVGRYRDSYRRTPTGWEFAARCVTTDFAGDLSRHYVRAGP